MTEAPAPAPGNTRTAAPGAQDLADDLAVALAAAEAGMAEARRLYHHAEVQHKDDGSEVTAADLAAETAIRKVLQEARPQDTLVGEEFGGTLGDGRQWIVDPIDGTTCFALGLPTFGTLVGLAIDGEPVVGVIGAPVTGELTYAHQGGGCHWRANLSAAPQPVRVRPVESLEDAWVAAAGPNGANKRHKDALTHRFDAILKKAGRFRYIGDCTQHALLCRGKVDLVLDTEMSPWDIAALVTPLRESGASVVGVDGGAGPILTAGGIVAASSPALLEQAMSLLPPRQA
ncbi:MAG: inositol monophosphatase family protein [Planctomycetota bacterium]